jgi:hypothetical protein
MANKLKISLCFDGHATVEPPMIKIYHNQNLILDCVVENQNQWVDFEISLESVNQLTLDFYNKKPEHTIVDGQGKITQDLWLELNQIRFDDILLQSWFLNDGWYEPRYFKDFLENFPNQPEKLPSQRIWHFPGKYTINFSNPFWPWYSNNRKHYSKKINVDKDQERWENYSGSFDSHQDLINEIYNLINVPKNSNSNVS